MEPEGLAIMHYVNGAYFTTRTSCADHVQSLIYFNSTRGPILIGAMYIMPGSDGGPEIGGSLTVCTSTTTSASTDDRRHRCLPHTTVRQRQRQERHVSERKQQPQHAGDASRVADRES